MEKLMKYVEEMQKEWINVCRPQVKQYYILYMILISKHYPLIKWLVDNDKIDQTHKFCVSVNVEWKGMGYTKAFDGYESLLMLLAIQDEPIEFLCSILK